MQLRVEGMPHKCQVLGLVPKLPDDVQVDSFYFNSQSMLISMCGK